MEGLAARRETAAASAARRRRGISEVWRRGVSRLLGRPNPTNVSIASAPMRTALERRATRLDVSMRPGGLLAPLPLLAGISAALVAAAVLFSNGSSDDPLIWIGGLAIAFAAAAAVSAAVGAVAAPRSRPDWLRAAAVVYLYAALVALALTFSRGGVAVGIATVAFWIAIGRPRLESAAALAIALVPTLVVCGWAFSRPGLTRDAQPRSLQVHDGRWFGLALVLGGVAAFAAAFFAARYENERPLTESWRRRLGRAAALAVVVAALVGVGALLAAGITPSRVLHKFNEPTPTSAAQGANNLTNFSSSSRWNWWQEAWKSWRAHPVLGTGAGTFDLTHRKLRVDGTVATEPHNLPLQFLSETGIFGFILFLGIALAGAGALVETLRRLEGEDRLAAAALVVALFAYVVHGVVDFDWDFIAVTAPAVAVLGVLLAAGRAARVRLRARRGVLAVSAGAFAAAALYSLASPWLAARRVDDAYAALSRGDAGAAVSDARSAHDLNPVSVDALLAWGLAEAARGDVAAAGRLYTKAISIQPDNWRPWYFRARLLEKIAGPKVALFDAQQAAARDPRGLAGAYAASLATAS